MSVKVGEIELVMYSCGASGHRKSTGCSTTYTIECPAEALSRNIKLPPKIVIKRLAGKFLKSKVDFFIRHDEYVMVGMRPRISDEDIAAFLAVLCLKSKLK